MRYFSMATKMKSMRRILFLDTEFTELTQQAQLISLALVGEGGAVFYAELDDYDLGALGDWHREHVVAQLLPEARFNQAPAEGQYFVKGPAGLVSARLADWLARLGAVEIWADVLAWDWVLFCGLFGGALGIPENVYYIPFDLSTLLRIKGLDPDLDRAVFASYKDPDGLERHNALYDARMELAVYRKLTSHE